VLDDSDVDLLKVFLLCGDSMVKVTIVSGMLWSTKSWCSACGRRICRVKVGFQVCSSRRSKVLLSLLRQMNEKVGNPNILPVSRWPSRKIRGNVQGLALRLELMPRQSIKAGRHQGMKALRLTLNLSCSGSGVPFDSGLETRLHTLTFFTFSAIE
jgi:hypothetical protein